MSDVPVMPIEQRLQIADRHIWNAIHEMIQADPVKALVELITNADDSYARLERQGAPVTGRIVVEVAEHRGRHPSRLVVRDDAEGFDLAGLDARVGRMGEATSGLERGADVRGVWGDGLKEAALGLGRGATVTAVRGGVEVAASLRWSERREPLYRRVAAGRPVDAARRLALDLPGDGTVVEVELGPDVRVPRHETLMQRLSLHHALRDIVRSPARQLLVRRLQGERACRQDRAGYRDPVVDPALAVVEHGTVPGWKDAGFALHVWRATEPLSGAEEGPYRTGGVLVQAGRALVDLSFFGLEHVPGTEYLFARLICPALQQRMREGDPVLSRNRTGLNRDNPFVRALLGELEALLRPIVQREEARLAQAPAESPVSDLEAESWAPVLRELARIGRAELGRRRATPPPAWALPPAGAGGEPGAPTEGLAFAHPAVCLQVGRWTTQHLCIGAAVLASGLPVTLAALHDRVEVEPLALDPEALAPGTRWVTAALRLRGAQVGAEDVVVARAGAYEARLEVRVVARRERASAAVPPLVRAIHFDGREDAQRRAVLVEDSGTLVVFVNAPGLRRYLGDGASAPPAAARAILAEVIAQTFCEHVALAKYGRLFLTEVDDPVAAVLDQAARLLNTWGEAVHAAINPA